LELSNVSVRRGERVILGPMDWRGGINARCPRLLAKTLHHVW